MENNSNIIGDRGNRIDSVEDNEKESDEVPKRKKRRLNTRKKEKRLRDHGQQSITRQGKIIPGKEFEVIDKCCRKECYKKLSEQEQKIFHDNFYKCSKMEQNQILAGGIILSTKKCERKGRGKTGIIHDRKITVEYFLKIDGCKVSICKMMFQTLHGVTRFKLDYLVEKLKNAPVPVVLEDRRGHHEPVNKKTEERKRMLEHIEKYPKYESHYSRRDSQKKYLQSHLNIRVLYNEYKKEHQNAASYDLFREVFKSTGYSFKKPHVDTCKTCDSYAMKIKCTTDIAEKNQLTIEHNEHKDMADLAYKYKDADKKKAKEDRTFRVIVFDLQQVLDTPSLTANVSFYKRLLATYNLTTRECNAEADLTDCYMWHEAIGKRGSEEIASCILAKLESLPSEVTHVVTYSDTCGGQNRNINMACMFSFFVSQSSHVNCLDQKFLLSGHTHLECDVDHARIERAKKTAEVPIMVPRDWYQFIRTLRGKKPFHVHEMTQENIMSFSTVVQEHFIRRTVDTDGNKVNWLEIKWLRYEKTFGLIKFKTALDDYTFRTLDLRRIKRGRGLNPVMTKCYDAPLPINPLKKKDLLSLLPIIDPECHNFYLNLKDSSSIPELDDVSDSNSE